MDSKRNLDEYKGIKYKSSLSFGTLHTLLEILEKKEGKLLDDLYKGVGHIYSFKCKENHIFKQRAQSIIYLNRWCPNCKKETKIEDYIQNHNGKLINIVDKNVSIKCNHNHKFSYNINHILRTRSWCKKCEYINQYGYFPDELYNKMVNQSTNDDYIKEYLQKLKNYNKELQLFHLGIIFNIGITKKLWDYTLGDFFE